MKNILLLIFFSLLSLELFSFIATKAELLLFNDIPALYRSQYLGNGWRTHKEPWGAWHKANATDRHRSACFDVRYHSNDVGARDTAFNYAKEELRTRYILLGDSFAEGWGVDIENTAQAQLERLLGIDVYNFGSDGYFGPIQYYLIYKDLASKFDHDGIILFFLPQNDFTDNDFALWKNVHPTWYRPYYKKRDDGEYDIFYPDRAIPSEQFQNEQAELGAIKYFLFRNTFTANTLRTVSYMIAENSIHKSRYSGYYDATRAQQEAAIYYIEKIVAEAKGKRVMILVIPYQKDLAFINSGRPYKDQYWYQQLMSLETSKTNVDVIHMADKMPSDYNNAFLPCEHHWSESGNLLAANIIADRYRSSLRRSNALNQIAPSNQ